MEINQNAALVTGGASGLGLAVGRRLADLGAKVTLLDLAGDALERAARELGCRGLPCDVTDAEQATKAVAAAIQADGPARLLVNCAGIAPAGRIVGREGPLPLDHFEHVIRVNLIGTFNLMRLAAAAMAATEPNEDGERGVIVNTASIAAFDGQIGQAAYAASKAGIVAMAKSIANEYAREGITANGLAPALIDTPMIANARDLADKIPVGRLGKPEEVAALVAFLASEHAAYITGEVTDINGGFLID